MIIYIGICVRIIGLLLCQGVLHGGEPPVCKTTPVGDWALQVEVTREPAPLKATLQVPPPKTYQATHQSYPYLLEFNPKRRAWTRGSKLRSVAAKECTQPGALKAGTVVVRAAASDTAEAFERDKDYELDEHWGVLGRLPGGKIKKDTKVYVSYAYTKRRLDSIVLTSANELKLKMGKPETTLARPPALAAGETRIANVFLSCGLTRLTGDNLFPILETAYPEVKPEGKYPAERLIPNAMRKLRKGEPIRIMAWGDSVTCAKLWQTMFVERLRARYPQAKIELVTEAWGGRTSVAYLREPPGAEHNFEEKVLDQMPDLIISEFVNDAAHFEDPARYKDALAQYETLLGHFKGIGAEWIILTPHYTNRVPKMKDCDEDPRTYVKAIREFSKTHSIAVADASLRWGRLWRQGIPFLPLLNNNVNHPTKEGHALFSDSLMELFPEE